MIILSYYCCCLKAVYNRLPHDVLADAMTFVDSNHCLRENAGDVKYVIQRRSGMLTLFPGTSVNSVIIRNNNKQYGKQKNINALPAQDRLPGDGIQTVIRRAGDSVPVHNNGNRPCAIVRECRARLDKAVVRPRD